MKIVDVFHFEDGRTILAGFPELGGAELHGMTAQLVHNGRPITTLRIDAVEFPRRIKQPAQRLFAVETRDVVDIDSKAVQNQEWLLRIET